MHLYAHPGQSERKFLIRKLRVRFKGERAHSRMDLKYCFNKFSCSKQERIIIAMHQTYK